MLDTPLTEAGAIVGTPGFMAPEQQQGAVVDARTDQFAYCVTLYYALYGRLPFAPDEPRTIETGPDTTPDKARPIPARLRRLLQRGLAFRAADRYPTLEALLDDLERDAGARLRRALPLVITIAVAAALAAGLFVRQRAPASPCRDAARRLDETWTAGARRAIEAAFLATHRPQAPDAGRRVAAALDDYAARWRGMRIEACEATQVEHTQSAALLDLRMACLDRRLSSMKELVGVFSGAIDGEALDHALDAVLSMPGLERCADATALSAVVPLPDDPARRQAVAGFEQKMARAGALESAGRYEPAMALLEPALPAIRQLAHAPLLSEALDVYASLSDHLGRDEQASKLWQEAAEWAGRAHDDERTAAIFTNLVWSLGYKQERFGEALLVGKLARAVVARTGDLPRLNAQLIATTGAVKIFKGDYAEAEAELREALRIREQALGRDSLAVARTLDALGTVLEFRGKYDEAVAAGRRTLAIRERLFGSDNPDVAFSLVNLAEGYVSQGRWQEAAPMAQRALEIRERTLPPGHQDIGWALVSRGGVHQAAGRYDEALADYDRAGKLLGIDGEVDSLGAGIVMRRRGSLYLERGDNPRAIETLARALKAYEKSGGDKHPDLPSVLLLLARAELRVGQARAAATRLERAAKLGAEAHAPRHTMAEVRLRLAQASWALGDRPRSHTEATAARELLRDAGSYPVIQTLLDETNAWLAAHR